MEKIDHLTKDQACALERIRAEMFARATDTRPADRPRAEAAARKLAELAGMSVSRVVWVNSPGEGAAILAQVPSNTRSWWMYKDQLREELWNVLREALTKSVTSKLWDVLLREIREYLTTRLMGSLDFWGNVHHSAERKDTVIDGTSVHWLAFYELGGHLVGGYPPNAAEKLQAHVELVSACFALWFTDPATLILCERPQTVTFRDGGLAGLTWRAAPASVVAEAGK